MTDYSFGDRLAKLRKERGYSQFQLARMMDVTDKAVSKWETGMAKPRSTACARLAALLGVDVDQLMDGDTLSRDEADRLRNDRRSELWKRAEERMGELYGEEPPLPVLNRFLVERDALHRTDAVILFDVLARVSREARQRRKGFSAGGAVCFVSWLLGATEVNPLAPHYRCPKCRRTEFHPEAADGWDLPEKACECGGQMIPDGHDIPAETCILGGANAYEFFRCETDADFLGEAERIILTCGEPFYSMEKYHEDGSEDVLRTPKGVPVTDPETGKPIPVRTLPMASLMFLPKKKAKIRKPERISGPTGLVNWGRRTGQPTIVLLGGFYGPHYLSEPSPFGSFPDELARQDVMERALGDYLKYGGSEAEAVSDMKLPDPALFSGRLTFSLFISVLCAANNLYMDSGPEELAEKAGFSGFAEMPLSMEDLWRMIARSTAYPGYMSGAAGEILRNTGSGRYAGDPRQGFGERDKRLFREMNLPDWFGTYASGILRLCWRSECVNLGIRLLEDARRKIRDGK